MIFLRLQQIPQQPSCRRNGMLLFTQSKSIQRCYMKMFFQRMLCRFIIKHPIIYIFQRDLKSFFQLQGNRMFSKFRITNNFCRGKPRHLVQNASGCQYRLKFCCLKFSSRYIAYRNAIPAFRAINRQNIVVFGFIQHGMIQDRTWRNHTNDFSFYNAFCRFWIFHLLTDCYTIPFFH